MVWRVPPGKRAPGKEGQERGRRRTSTDILPLGASVSWTWTSSTSATTWVSLPLSLMILRASRGGDESEVSEKAGATRRGRASAGRALARAGRRVAGGEGDAHLSSSEAVLSEWRKEATSDAAPSSTWRARVPATEAHPRSWHV